jgi:uncharacterized protein
LKRNLFVFITGILFGTGLCISQMANPDKILDFLDITGNWDPSLLLVMAGALTITLPSFRVILKREQPLLGSEFYLPTRKRIDHRLIIGSALFGTGWGMVGYCPGPVITALGFGFVDAVIVIVAIIAGMILHKFILE